MQYLGASNTCPVDADTDVARGPERFAWGEHYDSRYAAGYLAGYAAAAAAAAAV